MIYKNELNYTESCFFIFDTFVPYYKSVSIVLFNIYDLKNDKE